MGCAGESEESTWGGGGRESEKAEEERETCEEAEKGVVRAEEAGRNLCGRSRVEERPGAGRSLQTFSSRALWEVAMV